MMSDRGLRADIVLETIKSRAADSLCCSANADNSEWSEGRSEAIQLHACDHISDQKVSTTTERNTVTGSHTLTQGITHVIIYMQRRL